MAKFELEKFDGTGDFSLWWESLKGILVHQKVAKMVGDAKLLEGKKVEEIAKMEEMAYHTTIMYLSNSVRRKLIAKTTAKGQVGTTIHEAINLLERLYDFRMNSSLSLDDNIDKFNETIVGLSYIKHEVDEENQPIILLRSLPIAYQEVKATIKYGGDVISFDDYILSLNHQGETFNAHSERHQESLCCKLHGLSTSYYSVDTLSK
ncbi:uncharacterized protein LOC133832431 [Humulus lupulus]|uniref:uncharacterized protein LOC133832431 n=1 Tax=Humulus lupulus TaxID=3486 RepID=UPI002B406E7C|nr:uncharacterized protein LOC133832431 [Humulus lupulus]